MKPLRRSLAMALAATPLALVAHSTRAQAAPSSWPEKAVRIVVPYTPGGFNDTLARLAAKHLQQVWGQPFVVENRPGSGTTIGTEIGLKAAPDGYTLTIASFPTVANQFLYKRLPYDTQRDMAPVIVAGAAPNLLVVRAESTINTMQELIDFAKANPGRLNYASAGNGSSNHLAMEYFKSETGTDIVHIPYKGSAPMVIDLLGGQVDIMFDNYPNTAPHVNTGKMRALAITAAQRAPDLPDIPTVAEQGFPGFTVYPWYGFMAPAGTPRAILEKLNVELNRMLQQEESKALFAKQGVNIIGGSLDDFAQFFAAQSRQWQHVIERAGITLD